MDIGAELKKFTELTGVSGFEVDLANYIKKKFKGYCDDVEIDKFFNVSGIIKGSGENKKKIMISAHCDEIGLLVKSIDENGFIKLTNIGGIDSKILPAQEVVIHGRRDIYGVIGAKPPHLLKQDEIKKAVKKEDLSIDTGMNCDKVKELISIGDVVTFKAVPSSLTGNKISSKSIDNRCGIVTLLKVMSEISKFKIHNDVCFIASTQEEVGLRGITTAAYNIQPDIAVVVDACHGDIPDVSKDEVYALGKGPAIGIGPNLNKEVTKILLNTAKDENIPYQIDVEAGDSGTEAWAIQVSRSGIPTVLVSIPVRYMHTPIETVHTDDIKNAGKLIVYFINSVDTGLGELLCY